MNPLHDPALLRAVLEDYARQTRFRGAPATWTYHREEILPHCGDRLSLYVTRDDTRCLYLAYEASGCLLSQASAAMMVDLLQHSTLYNARLRVSSILQMFTTGESDQTSLPPPLTYLMPMLGLPTRRRCATFPWNVAHALLQAIPDDSRTPDDNPHTP